MRIIDKDTHLMHDTKEYALYAIYAKFASYALSETTRMLQGFLQ